jgi:hypothetical protein
MLSTNRKLDTSTAKGRETFQHSVMIYPADAVPRSIAGGEGYIVGDSEGTLHYRNLMHALADAHHVAGLEANRTPTGRKAAILYSRDGKAPYYLLDGQPSDADTVAAIERGEL